MTSVGNNWYIQSFPAATSVSMVFNNGAGAQYPTVGGKLTRTESGCFDMATKAWTTWIPVPLLSLPLRLPP